MTHTAPARLICQVCNQPRSPHEGMMAELIRPSLVEFIKKRKADWDDKGFVCFDDLGEFRKNYVREMLQDELSELSVLEREVIESLHEHEIISTDVSREFSHEAHLRRAAFGSYRRIWRKLEIHYGVRGVLIAWILLNAVFLWNRGFDPYPFILLNLILSCLAAIQAADHYDEPEPRGSPR